MVTDPPLPWPSQANIHRVCGENHKKAAILNSCLFAEFVSMCQPVCNYEGLKASVYLNMWLFLWDDCKFR